MTNVELKFSNELINVVIDRFGKESNISEMDNDHFKLTAEVNAGEGFLLWILQFGEKVQILYPEALRKRLINKIDKMREEYRILYKDT